MLGLTCRFGRELVPVGSTHCQQPVAQIQVKPLLSGYAAHHLEERAAHENRSRVKPYVISQAMLLKGDAANTVR